MGYSNTVDILKNALKNYSEQEIKLRSLYADAKNSAKEEYKDTRKLLDAEYRKERNRAYTDTLRNLKNTEAVLSKKGLGSSGEASLSKINSDMMLSNRLSELSDEKLRAETVLKKNFQEALFDSDKEESKRISDLEAKRQKSISDIAEIERKKEESEKQAKPVSSENKKPDGTGGKNETYNKEENESENAFIPSISAKDLAKQLVSIETDGKMKFREGQIAYGITEFLSKLEQEYTVDKNYMDNLLFCLESYGYRKNEYRADRIKRITRDARGYYSREFSKKRAALSPFYPPERAEAEAKECATAMTLAHVYAESFSDEEFRTCATVLGIPEFRVDNYLEKIKNKHNNRN